MNHPFVCVRDSDGLVMLVSKVAVENEPAGATTYEEAYNGTFLWNASDVNVYRHGASDYREEPLP